MKDNPLTISDKLLVNYSKAGVIKQRDKCGSRLILIFKNHSDFSKDSDYGTLFELYQSVINAVQEISNTLLIVCNLQLNQRGKVSQLHMTFYDLLCVLHYHTEM